MRRHRHRTVTAGIFVPNRSIIGRFRHFIESTDWDEGLVRKEKWINRICLILIASSVLYLAPVVVLRFLR